MLVTAAVRWPAARRACCTAAATWPARICARKLTGERPSDAYFRTVTTLGARIAEGGFEPIAGIPPGEILMPYESSTGK